MSDSVQSVVTEKGIVDLWSQMLDPWRRMMPDLPTLAPSKLYQNIMSSLISGGHFSLIAHTVNQQATQAPELEEQIVTKVASYGKQLGRLIDAVEVLVQHTDPEIAGDERLEQLTSLAEEIRTERRAFAKNHVDQILASITELGRPDHVDRAALGQIRNLIDRLDRHP